MILAAAAFVCAHNLRLDARLAGSFREDRAGWIYLRLKGSPDQVGFQQGYLAAPEIMSFLHAIRVQDQHDAKGDPKASMKNEQNAFALLWNKVPSEYQEEIKGIAAGVKARGYPVSLQDVFYNAAGTDYGYYTQYQADLKKPKKDRVGAGDHCSAFVATGAATKDGKIVMAHNCWTTYNIGEHNNTILDITPAKGNRILMDSFPGHIDSGDDFGINSAGIMITETTISDYVGFDTKGIPEFVRMREAIQYGNSLDDVVKWFVHGNNGAYANMWLLGDLKSNEIGKLELGLKNVIFSRSSDGSYTSSNFPEDPKLTAEECLKDEKLGSNMCSDRRARWNVLMAQNKGKIDAELGKAFVSDHYDQVLQKEGPSLSDLCGHGELEARADHIDTEAYEPMGSVQGKVVTAEMAKRMSFWARMGHPCGTPFVASQFMAAHPEFKWMGSTLGDMPTQPWVTFKSR